MITRRAKLVARLAAVVAALAAAPAQAATPFNIGNGLRPSVAVDAEGNGYFAWLEKRAGTVAEPGQIHFCKVLVGTTTCAVRAQFAAPSAGLFAGEAAGYPQVFLMATGQPTIFTNCRQCFGGGDRGSQFVSTNGGASFVPRPSYGSLGIIGAVAGSGKSAYDPAADAVFGIWSTGELQRMPIANPTVTPTVTASLGPFAGGSNDEAAVSYVGAGPTQTQVAVIAGRATSPEIRFKHHTNPTDPNVTGNWLGGDVPIAGGQHVALATGPSGIVLVSARETPAGIQAQRFAAATKTFSAATPISSEAQGEGHVRGVDLHQSTTGRLHALWQVPFGGAFPAGARYATSPDGATWSGPQSIVADANLYDARVAGTANANKGWLVYANGDIVDSTIRAATLDPIPPPPPPPPPPPAVSPPPPPPPAAPATYTGANRTVTVSDRNASYRFSVPRSCVVPGQTFTTTLRWAKKKRKGNLFVKVARVDFYLGSRRLTIDRRAPFVKRYKIVATQQRGSTITVRARAFIKVRRGKAPTKSLRAAIKVCA